MSSVLPVRPPLLSRLWVVAFGLFWCGSVLLIGVRAAQRNGAASAAPSLLMLVFGAALASRLLLLGAVPDGDRLVIRNFFRTYTLRRAEIEDFRAGPAPRQPFGAAVSVLLRDGRALAIDASAGLYVLGRGKALLADRVRALQDWLAG